MYYWTKIEVYNEHEYLGDFYTIAETKKQIIQEINEKFGKGTWTRYGIGN